MFYNIGRKIMIFKQDTEEQLWNNDISYNIYNVLYFNEVYALVFYLTKGTHCLFANAAWNE